MFLSKRLPALLPIPAIPYTYPTHTSRPLTSDFSIPNPTLQVTYESGCAPWICANYAQLPKKPEVDTLKKIVFIGRVSSMRKAIGCSARLPTRSRMSNPRRVYSTRMEG